MNSSLFLSYTQYPLVEMPRWCVTSDSSRVLFIANFSKTIKRVNGSSLKINAKTQLVSAVASNLTYGMHVTKGGTFYGKFDTFAFTTADVVCVLGFMDRTSSVTPSEYQTMPLLYEDPDTGELIVGSCTWSWTVGKPTGAADGSHKLVFQAGLTDKVKI